LGEACLRAHDRQRAKAAFAKSIKIAPDYLYGGFQLFELQLADKEYAAADQTLATMRPHTDPAEIKLREVRLAAAQQDQQAASAKLGELCVLPSRDGAQLRDAVDVLRKQAWMPVVEKAFAGAIEMPQVHASVGGLSVEHLTGAGRFKQAMKLVEQLMGRGEVGLRAASVFLQDAAEKQQKRFVHKVIRRHRAALQRDP